MPTWDPEEIETARQCIFNSQPKTEVDDRLKRWGGVPLYVLQRTDPANQAMLVDALNSCRLSNLVRCMTDLSHASGSTHMLLHQRVSAGYTKGPVEFASYWVKEELVARYLQFDHREVQWFLATIGMTPTIEAYEGQLQTLRACNLLWSTPGTKKRLPAYLFPAEQKGRACKMGWDPRRLCYKILTNFH